MSTFINFERWNEPELEGGTMEPGHRTFDLYKFNFFGWVGPTAILLSEHVFRGKQET